MKKPYYQDLHNTLYSQDFRKNGLPDEFVQCVVTSPPYWGLRKYSGEQELVWGRNEDNCPRCCEHQWVKHIQKPRGGRNLPDNMPNTGGNTTQQLMDNPRFGVDTNFCSLCGAWRGAYGLEPTPEMYVQHTIEILREIRRVLRKDGVVFWNIGDSYNGSGGEHKHGKGQSGLTNNRDKVGFVPGRNVSSLKPKDLCLIPFRVAIAAQEAGWYVRSDIIWSKNNPMPESVTDRPTNSHEHILMLTKSAKYYWDADAVREKGPQLGHYRKDGRAGHTDSKTKLTEEELVNPGFREKFDNPLGRNIRSVWEFPTQPYPEAHFAVFPEKLPELCIKAATPEVGCCSKCGSPWVRVTEKVGKFQRRWSNNNAEGSPYEKQGSDQNIYEYKGWQPTCKCNADKVPSLVLDPFAGAGTTLWVAKKLNRKAVGYEISEEYCQLIVERIRQQVMIDTTKTETSLTMTLAMCNGYVEDAT